MPLTLPNLDDRSYEELVAEARARIPSLCAAWTDHNPTDPGIALLELFAWLTEIAIYRIDRIPEQHYRAFLQLLNPAGLQPENFAIPSQEQSARQPIDDAIRETLLQLRKRYRAATSEDFEQLILETWNSERQQQIARARAIPQCDLSANPAVEAPAHLSIVIVPKNPADELPDAPPELCKEVGKFLEPRRLLTTRLHVVGPAYVTFQLDAVKVGLREGYRHLHLADTIVATIRAYFHPLRGGPDGSGWPFGRAIYSSEIYALLDRQPEIDYVSAVELTGKPEEVLRHHLVRVEIDQEKVTIENALW